MYQPTIKIYALDLKGMILNELTINYPKQRPVKY